MSEKGGLKSLEDSVLAKDLCVACGACASLCPYLRSSDGRIVKLHDCDLTEGRCFDYCPRTEVDVAKLHQAVFGRDHRDLDIGSARRVVAARGIDPEVRNRGQTGGVVSTLVSLALEEGWVQAAILTERQADLLPRGRVVRDPREVVTLAGSGYVAGPTLEALNGGSFENEDRIAVVGLPCQITALAKMRVSRLDRRTPIDQVVLTIGLFCTWALSYGPFVDYLKSRVGRAKVGKMDITPPPERLLLVTTDSETSRIPLDEIRPFVRPGCDVCLDMTAELADLSVGTVEGRSGWNTVIVRTRAGKEIFSRAEAVGAIETESLAEDYLDQLREASRLKKYRALKALEGRGDTDGGYLRLPNRLKRRIMSCGEEGL